MKASGTRKRLAFSTENHCMIHLANHFLATKKVHFFLLLRTSLHPPFVSHSQHPGDHSELQDTGEDKENAGDHPQVQEGDVGDPWYLLADGTKHGCQCQDGGHPHPNAT